MCVRNEKIKLIETNISKEKELIERINKNLKNIKIMKITFIIGCLFNVFGLVIIIKGRIPFI